MENKKQCEFQRYRQSKKKRRDTAEPLVKRIGARGKNFQNAQQGAKKPTGY